MSMHGWWQASGIKPFGGTVVRTTSEGGPKQACLCFTLAQPQTPFPPSYGPGYSPLFNPSTNTHEGRRFDGRVTAWE